MSKHNKTIGEMAKEMAVASPQATKPMKPLDIIDDRSDRGNITEADADIVVTSQGLRKPRAAQPAAGTTPQKLKIQTTCFTCGQEWEREDGHDCPMKDKLTPQEQEICGAMLVASGCDHFCCGLSPVACQARTIAHFLNTSEGTTPQAEQPELCDHGIPLSEAVSYKCRECWEGTLDGAMAQAERGAAAHILAGAPFNPCPSIHQPCVICDALLARAVAPVETPDEDLT